MMIHKEKDLALDYLTLIGNCYATGDFEPLFPYLSDDCVWESQWRLDPENGKQEVIEYFRRKGKAVKRTGTFPKWMIVQLVGSINYIHGAYIKAGEKPWETASVGLIYTPGELALFMSQDLADYSTAMIARITMKDNLISRIDICMPELFKFEKWNTNDEAN